MSSASLNAPEIGAVSPAVRNHTDPQIRHCYEINLQTGLGGGEIYTRFFTQALLDLGWKVTLIAKRGSWLALHLHLPGLVMIEVDHLEDVPSKLGDDNCPVFTHNPFSGPVAEEIRKNHRLICFAHMPLYGRTTGPFKSCDLILAVSRHVINSLKASGLNRYYPEPLYGVADLERGEDGSPEIRRGSLYDWDRRKFRDWVLSLIYPLTGQMKRPKVYGKRPGLTLGIVSRLTPIKQFPLLFAHLAPILARYPMVNVEIFGSGGYASVRDLRFALKPIAQQVRFWGEQRNVAAVYQNIDYLLSGLPEKEALGLNILEAQLAGTPVIAVNAPPFTETVLDGSTGYLYTDPRQDNGVSFSRVIAQALDVSHRPNPLLYPEHLKKFCSEAFRERLQGAMATLARDMR